MKLGKRDVCYRPYSITTIKEINKDDINETGALIIPDGIDEIEKDAIPDDIKIQTVVISNINIQIVSSILKRMNSKFILSKGEELDSLFSGILSPEVILPKTLISIKKPGFRNSIIDRVEIPNSVISLDDDIFNHSRIKKLVINEGLLSQISAKFLLFIKDNISLTVKVNAKQTKKYICPKINVNFISSIGYIDKAIDVFLENINKSNLSEEKIVKIKHRLKRKFLMIIRMKLLLKKDSQIVINDLVLHDIYLKKIIENTTLKLLPKISCDGLSIKINDDKIKMFTLKNFIDQI